MMLGSALRRRPLTTSRRKTLPELCRRWSQRWRTPTTWTQVYQSCTRAPSTPISIRHLGSWATKRRCSVASIPAHGLMVMAWHKTSIRSSAIFSPSSRQRPLAARLAVSIYVPMFTSCTPPPMGMCAVECFESKTQRQPRLTGVSHSGTLPLPIGVSVPLPPSTASLPGTAAVKTLAVLPRRQSRSPFPGAAPALSFSW